jgi:hypothetical protein
MSGGARRLLYTAHLDRGDPDPAAAEWLPGGRAFVLKAHDSSGVAEFLRVEPGHRRRLLARLDDPLRPSPRSDLATDGRRLYFVVNDRQSDIYLADLEGLGRH